MTQTQWIVLAFKAVLLSGIASLILWIGIYTRLARWWASPIGRTLVIKTMLITLMFIPTTLAMFFHFSAFGSLVAGWADVGLVGLVTPVMIWRSAVWLRIRREGRAGQFPGGPAEGDGT